MVLETGSSDSLTLVLPRAPLVLSPQQHQAETAVRGSDRIEKQEAREIREGLFLLIYNNCPVRTNQS